MERPEGKLPASKKRKLTDESTDDPVPEPSWQGELKFLQWDDAANAPTADTVLENLIQIAPKLDDLEGLLGIWSGAHGYSFQTIVAFCKESAFVLLQDDLNSPTCVWKESPSWRKYSTSHIDELMQSLDARRMAVLSALRPKISKDSEGLHIVEPRLEYHPWKGKLARVGLITFYNMNSIKKELEENNNVNQTPSDPITETIATGYDLQEFDATHKEYGALGDALRWIKIRRPCHAAEERAQATNEWELFVFHCFNNDLS
jgi:hypothetical protein